MEWQVTQIYHSIMLAQTKNYLDLILHYTNKHKNKSVVENNRICIIDFQNSPIFSNRWQIKKQLK